MLKRRKLLDVALLLIVISWGCNGEKMQDLSMIKSELSKIVDSDWNALSEKRIYFAHQSVGENIVDGIYDIQKIDKRINLKFFRIQTDIKIEEHGFYHSHIGRNGDPKSKVDDFANKLENGIGSFIDIAFLKFCYLDLNSSTDPAALFSYYKNMIERLKSKFPKIIFIHSTMPLVMVQDGPKALIKKILGKPIGGVDENIKLNEYNRLILEEYGAKDPIFDLAKAESAYPDKTQSFTSNNGKFLLTLVPIYTDDGGHLNSRGRVQVAVELLQLLSKVGRLGT